jgi:hypothetical protein
MSRLTLPVDPRGRLVVKLYLNVGTVRRSALAQSGQQIPIPVQVNAMIDTGASMTVVEESILKNDLKLLPTGDILVHTASTGAIPVKRDLYRVEVALAEAVTGTLASNLEVIAVDTLAGLGVGALLGRDVLSTLYFEYKGVSDEFTIDIP